MPTIRPTRAHEGETVEIRWTLADGGTYYQRVTVPPRATREWKPWAGKAAEPVALTGDES